MVDSNNNYIAATSVEENNDDNEETWTILHNLDEEARVYENEIPRNLRVVINLDSDDEEEPSTITSTTTTTTIAINNRGEYFL